MRFEKDRERIALLYEDLYNNDFLSVDESLLESYDWNTFFNSEYVQNRSAVILEEFEKIADGEKTYEGVKDVYKVILKNGKEFSLQINYSTPSNSKSSIDAKIANASHERKNRNDIAELYVTHFSDLRPNECIAMIQFADNSGRFEQTGDVGPSAKELFHILKDGIMDSFWNGGRIDNLRGFMMRVDRKESRRLTLYKKLVERYLHQVFPNNFVDDFSEDNYYLLVCTK